MKAFMTYYWDVLRNHYVDFKGRATRKTYWLFVLFNSIEDEQEVASKLMKQLFANAADKIITELEIKQRKKNNDAGLPPIITPVSNSPAKTDAL